MECVQDVCACGRRCRTHPGLHGELLKGNMTPSAAAALYTLQPPRPKAAATRPAMTRFVGHKSNNDSPTQHCETEYKSLHWW